MAKILILNKQWASVGELANSEYIGRPSPLGNPFVIGRDGTREDVIEKCSLWLKEALYFKVQPEDASEFLLGYAERMTRAYTEFDRLRDKYDRDGRLSLACWCAPLPCHGDVIAGFIETWPK